MSDCGTGLFVHWLKTLCSPIKTDLEWPYLGVYQIFRHTQITSEYIARRKINKYHKPCWILGEVYQESYIAVCVNHNKWTTRHFYHFLSHSREYCEVSYEKIGMLIWVKSPQCASFLQVFLFLPLCCHHLNLWLCPMGFSNFGRYPMGHQTARKGAASSRTTDISNPHVWRRLGSFPCYICYLRSPIDIILNSTDPWTHCVIPLQDHGFCVFFCGGDVII